jgi:CRISP-associated protein Cas1
VSSKTSKNSSSADRTEPLDIDTNELWDESLGTVPGGVNWATDYADNITEDSFLGITGPDIDPAKQVDW